MPVHVSESSFPLIHLENDDDWNHLPDLCKGFLTARDFRRIRDYLASSAKSILIEHEYIDKDYRDTYTNFYSKKFANYPSRTVRLHFFTCIIAPDAIWNLANHQDDYIGCVVIRPTRIASIGRTMLDPRKVKGRIGEMCLTEFNVNVLGSQLRINAFPFISQDSDVTVCAHAACWTMFRYFSERYPRYAEIWPYELTQLTADYSLGRLVPSRSGITIHQVSEICSKFGFSPELYFRDAVEKQFSDEPDPFERLLCYYVESGLPCVVSLPGHAMTVFGHVSDKSKVLKADDLILHFLEK